MRRCITTSSEQYKFAFAVSMGGMLELYDFLIYALMASYISEHFFPVGDQFSALLATFATFAVGYLPRPIGGLILGYYGDRYGREKTFTVSIILMAFSTLLIGLLPGYSSIGFFAPLCLSVLRLIQGAALGGDIPGAITYLSKRSPDHQGLIAGILFLALMVSISFGALVHGVLTLYLDRWEMMKWGWRIPFLLGGLLGIISYLIRRRFNKSGFLLALDQARQGASVPLRHLLKKHLSGVFYGVLVMALYGATVSVYGAYMPGYLSSLLGFPRDEVAWHMALAFLILAPVPLVSGLCCDLFNRRVLMILLALAVVCLTWPTFQYFVDDDARLRKILMICGLYTGLASGLLPPMLVSCFPAEVRYTGVAITYNTGFAVFGGMAPFIATLMTEYSSLAEGPAIYMIIVASLCLLTLFLRLPDYVDSSDIQKANTDGDENSL